MTNHSDDELDEIFSKFSQTDDSGSVTLTWTNRDVIEEAKAALQTYIEQEVVKGRIDELYRIKDAEFDPNKTLVQVLMFVDARIRELHSPKDTEGSQG
jgi:hypothetical protein